MKRFIAILLVVCAILSVASVSLAEDGKTILENWQKGRTKLVPQRLVREPVPTFNPDLYTPKPQVIERKIELNTLSSVSAN